MAYVVGAVCLLLVIAVSLLLARSEKMSEGKFVLCAIGGALGVVVILVALFGAFYESPS